MRKELPWTLEKEQIKKESTKSSKAKNTYELLLGVFKSNKNKEYSTSELMKEIKRCKAVVTVALTSLIESKSVKIVGFEERGYGNIAPLYQHIDGKGEEAYIIDQNSKEYIQRNLITIRDFSKKKSGIPDSSKQTRLTCLINEFNIPFYYAKTSRSYFKAYNRNDLKNLLSKDTVQEKVKGFSFKIFKWTITIN